MASGMNLSGQLSDWTMDDLIQIVQVTKKTGSLEVNGSSKGRLHFLDGLITGAELHEQRGIYAGTDVATIADVVFVLSGFKGGTFALGPLEGPEEDGIDPAAVLEGVDNLKTLAADMGENDLLDGTLQVSEEIDGDIKLSAEQWRSLTMLLPTFTLESLEARFGAGGALRLLHTLQKLEVLAQSEPDPVADADEAEWLDSLAKGVSSTDSTEWLDEKTEDTEDLVPITEPEQSEPARLRPDVRGVSTDPSTTLTDSVFDDIRRLRSKG